jgi:20S proteasome subunit beta 3
VEPVIAGLDKHNEPFVCSTDLIGCINFAKDFVVAGTASSNLYGMCESLWREDLVCISDALFCGLAIES